MHLFYILLVLLIVTRLFGELAERLNQPALLGELISGILLGVLVRHNQETFPVLAHLPENEVFRSLSDLGVFFLMVLGGLELHPRDVVTAGRQAGMVATAGLLVPLGLGMGLGWVILPPSSHHLAQVLFIGTALSITAVPVAIKVLMDLGELETPAGKLIVSAAVIDDVLSLVLLAVMTALMGTGSLPAWGDLLLLVGKIILFFFLASLAGRYLFPRLGRLVRRTHAQEFEFSMLLIAAFSYALLARLLGMHFILGAFLAGLFFVRGTVDEKVYEDVLGKTSALTTGFLAPIFFASIGMNLDLTALWNIPGTLVLLILVAVIGKVIGAGGASLAVGFSPEQSLSIGAAMNARGTVELIVADIALQAGLFTFPDPPPPIVKHLFSAVVLMAVFTTLITPTTLAMILKKGKKSG